MKKNILTIGPVTKDIIITPDNQYTQIGGSVYYIANIISQLNKDVTTIITLGENDLELVKDFPSKLHIIETQKTMEYTNIYKEDLERTQKADIPENPITIEKLEKIGVNYDDYSIVIVAPLSKYDIPQETIEYLKNKNLKVVLLAQGYLRKTTNDGDVIETPWDNYEKYLKHTDILTLDKKEIKKAFNIEDITKKAIISLIDNYDMDSIIITKAKDGSRIYTKDSLIDIQAFKCDDPKDPTGLGDTYIGAYVTQIVDNKSPREAGLFASMCAKMKLESENGFKISEKEVKEELKRSLKVC